MLTRIMRRTYGTVEEDPFTLLLFSLMSSYMLVMSGKKSSSGKSSSDSVMKMKPVAAQSAPQKPYRCSPVHERRGFGGLLSQLAVHAVRWDGEDLDRRKDSEPGGCTLLCVYFSRGRPLFYRHTGGGEHVAMEEKMNRHKARQQYSCPLQHNVSTSATI
jgi:hypothetical protein